MNVTLPPGTKIMTRNAQTLCFELPSMQHECRVMVYNHRIDLEVWAANDTRRLETFRFKPGEVAERWEDIVQSFIDKALRKYPKPIRHRSVTDERIRRGW